ncbi:MAG: BamA/TamA family outer membrane protein [Planctomycetota bacterium]
MGYLDAVVTTPGPAYDDVHKRMDVTYRIDEGDRFHLEAVTWAAAPAGDMELLIGMTRDYIGRPLGASLADTVAARIRTWYRNQGRPTVRVQAELELHRERHTGSITVRVAPGPLVSVERIELAGNPSVDGDFIRAMARVAEGDLLRSGRIREAERRLSDTGLFSEVWIAPLDPEGRLAEGAAGYDDAFQVPLALTVKEVKPHEMKVRLGYSDYERGIFGLEAGTRNAFGRGESLSLGATASSRGYRTDGDVQFYPFAGRPVKGGAHAFYEDRDEISYALRHAGVSPAFKFTLGRMEELSAGMLFEWIETNDLILGVPTDALTSFRVGAPFLSYTKDRRNSQLIPEKGYKLTARLELADSISYGDISYWRAMAGYQKYFPVGPLVTFAGSLRTGVIAPFGDTAEIPLALRYFAGGVASVRGFNELELGPQAGGEFVGGEVFGAFQGELRWRIVEDLHAAVFYDVGNVYATVSDLDLGEVKSGAGCGLRYYTPAGAIRFDAGWNTDPQPGEETVVLNFTIGMFF